MASPQEGKLAIDFIRLIHDAVFDQDLLNRAEKAYEAIKQSQEALAELDRQRDEFRNEKRVHKEEIDKLNKDLQGRESRLVTDREEHNRKWQGLESREAAIDARDRKSRESEAEAARRIAEAEKREQSVKAREDSAAERERELANRENEAKRREDKLREALK